MRALSGTWTSGVLAQRGPRVVRRGLLTGHGAPRDAGERALLAAVALEASGDGSRGAEEVRELARRALQGAGAGEDGTVASAATALARCDAFALAAAAVDGAGPGAGGVPAACVGADVLLRRGLLAEAQERLAALEDVALAAAEAAVAGPLRAGIALERGDADAAAAALAGAEGGAAWLLARARVRVSRGELSEALADALRAGAGGDAANPAALPWRSEAALIALRLGDREHARRLAATELRLARGFGAPRALGIAARAAGRVEGDPALLERSVAWLREADASLEVARSLVELGGHVRRSGERRQARELLREAQELADRLGATAVAGRAREELAAAGAKPRRAELSGAGSLTPSEHRVAALAAAGRSNREIAGELVVTMRTVTTHLTHVYRKLDIERREQLVDVLPADAGPSAEDGVPLADDPAGAAATRPAAPAPPEAAAGPVATPADAAAARLHDTEPAGDPQTVAALQALAELARRAGDAAGAAHHLRRALVEPPAPEGRGAVLRALGEAARTARDGDAATHLRAALTATDGAAARAEVAAALADVHWHAGHLGEAEAALEEAIAALGAEASPGPLACLESLRVCTVLLGDRGGAALAARTPRLDALAIAAGDAGRGLGALQRGLREAGASTRTALGGRADAGVLASDGVDADAAGAVVLAGLVARDDVAAAERLIAALSERAERHGAVAAGLHALLWASHLGLRCGRVADALADARAAAVLAAERDLGAFRPLAAAFLADAVLARDGADAAAEVLDGHASYGAQGTAADAYLAFSHGRVRLEQGRRQEAAAALRACRAASGALFCEDPGALPSRSALALALAAEEPQQAQRLVQEELTLARASRRPRAVGTALHAQARLSRGTEATACLQAAADVLAGSPATTARAAVLLDLGTPESVAEARELARRAGATVLLRAAG